MVFGSASQPTWRRFLSPKALCAPFTSIARAYYVIVLYGETPVEEEDSS
jgi:hypothetical protein